MVSAIEQAAYPVAACDSNGGLWLAYRSHPIKEKPYPPMVEIRLAHSYDGFTPRVVARGLGLSAPALAVGYANGEEVVCLAWVQGYGGRGGIRTVTATRSSLSSVHSLAGIEADAAIIGLTAGTDAFGRVWLMWQEVRGRRCILRISCRESEGWGLPETIFEPVAATAACMTFDSKGGLWVCGCNNSGQGFVPVLRHLSAEGIWEEPVAATVGEHLDLEPSIDIDARDRVYLVWKRVVHRWSTIAGARLNEETQLHLRVYDPALGVWMSLSRTPEVPLPISTRGRFAPVAGHESLEHWACPLAPCVFVDAEGKVHVLFRRFRDVHGVYDWGFDLYHMVWDMFEWSEPAPVSHTAGFPDRQYTLVRMADGGAALVYQFSHFPPTYWHCPDDYSLMPVVPSGIAITRLPWGGSVPPVRQIGSARPEALRPGEPQLARVPQVTCAEVLPYSETQTLPPSERRVSGTERCFFGELHAHSHLSLCMTNKDGSLWDHYRWALDIAGYDFYAVTDHVEHLGTAAWEQILSVADTFDCSGSFAALYGLEFTNRVKMEGRWSLQDLCLFTVDHNAAWCLWYHLRHGTSGEAFLQLLEKPELKGLVLIARHFHGGRGYGIDLNEPCNRLLEQAGPDIEPVLEIVQHRGSALPIVLGLLRSGQRKGVIGGPDHGRPGPGRKYVTALTGVWSTELDRHSILSALFRRRSFATNGPRMMVDFSVAGEVMGGEIHAEGAIQLEGFVQGTTSLRTVTIYRNTEAWQRIAGESDRCTFRLKDRPVTGDHFYWVYAEQEPEPGVSHTGELWSSPVWVTM